MERWQVAPDKAKVLSRLCRGAIGWAVSAAHDGKLLQERSEKLFELIGLATETLDQRFAFAAGLAVQFSKSRDSVEEVLKLWLGWWRDILLAKEGCAQLVTNIDQEETLYNHAVSYDIAHIRGFIKDMTIALEQMEQNANPRLALEVLMLSIPNKSEEQGKVPHRLGLPG